MWEYLELDYKLVTELPNFLQLMLNHTFLHKASFLALFVKIIKNFFYWSPGDMLILII